MQVRQRKIEQIKCTRSIEHGCKITQISTKSTAFCAKIVKIQLNLYRKEVLPTVFLRLYVCVNTTISRVPLAEDSTRVKIKKGVLSECSAKVATGKVAQSEGSAKGKM